MLANQQALLQRLEQIEKRMAEQEESDKKMPQIISEAFSSRIYGQYGVNSIPIWRV